MQRLEEEMAEEVVEIDRWRAANVAMCVKKDIKVETAAKTEKEARTHPTTPGTQDKLVEDKGDSVVMVAAPPVGIEEDEVAN